MPFDAAARLANSIIYYSGHLMMYFHYFAKPRTPMPHALLRFTVGGSLAAISALDGHIFDIRARLPHFAFAPPLDYSGIYIRCHFRTYFRFIRQRNAAYSCAAAATARRFRQEYARHRFSLFPLLAIPSHRRIIKTPFVKVGGTTVPQLPYSATSPPLRHKYLFHTDNCPLSSRFSTLIPRSICVPG